MAESAENELPQEDLKERLHGLANGSLELWGLPEDASARLINVSENATYLVETPDGRFKSVLRVHRESYHSRRAIECEFAWTHALREEGYVRTPEAIRGRDGRIVQTGESEDLPNPRYMVMFEFAPGETPDEDGPDVVKHFGELGAMAARLHEHAIRWQRPQPFERLVWNLESVYRANATWGNWRNGPNLCANEQEILERVERTVIQRLRAFGQSEQRYGLIHADMRLANLLVDGDTIWLIDFDDCGFGWFMYDFAAGISFIEDHPKIPEMRAAWVDGYRSVRELPDADEWEIDSFIMLRRMALLGWLATHIDAVEAQELAPQFARVSAELGERYLSRMT